MSNFIRAKITKAAIDRLEVGQTIRDTELKGFGARRQTDVPSYFLMKRIHGRMRWITIGPHGAPWTPETARREAFRLLGAIATGNDPASARQNLLENPTLAEAVSLFTAEHGPKLKPTTREKYRILFTLHIVPELGTRRITEIKRTDILKFHTKLAEKASTANYTSGHYS